ncbi:MAG: ABC transporter ATP-binding protein, partial [Acidimicrobiia bacterium]|nr:ABC transporter ATP-binding protein [Acidimicrobiia bacterium]
KTTTVLMLLGLSEPDGGTIRVCGMDPARNPLAVKRRVGYMPDTVGFYDTLTGRQNLRYTAALNELDPNEAEDRIDRLLSRVGLSGDADRPVRGYSRGMRQRLGLADALVKDPAVVILDEPMVGIDPQGVVEMRALITELARDDGRAVLLTSHMLHEVQQTCDRIAIFVGGRVIAEGTTAQLAAELADGRAAFEVVAHADRDRLAAALGAGRGVGATDVVPLGADRWRVSLPSDNVRLLVPALVEAGIDVRGLRDLGTDLDEIYHRYFRDSEEVGS